MRYYLRILSVAVMACVAVTSAAWTYPDSKPTTPFDGGTGTEDDPYCIATAQQLANFAWLVNDGKDFEGEYVVLTADITLNNIRCLEGTHKVVNLSTYTPWVMIGREGTISDDNFEGTFDGRGHKIIGLYIRDDGAFFRKVEGGTVRNVVFDTPFCYNDLVRDSDNKEVCYNAAFVSLYAREASFINCRVENAIVDAYCFDTFGGILNTNRTSIALTTDDVVVSKCSFNGYVILHYSAEYFGCIVGRSHKYDTNWYISECTASGEMIDDAYLKSSQASYGGIMGYADNKVTISKCVSYMDYTRYTGDPSTTASLGGILGFSIEDANVTINECANLGSIKYINLDEKRLNHPSYIGGIAGKLTGETTITNCASLGPINSLLKISDNTEGWKTSNFVGAIDGETIMANCVVVGENTEEGFAVNEGVFESLCAEVGEDASITANYLYYNCERITPSLTATVTSLISGSTECSLEQLRSDDMISTLNARVSGSIWGRLNDAESIYNGMPLPISCGGVVTMIAGAGTADNPYLIYNEAELRAVGKAVNGGNCMEGKYFRLSDDIEMSSEPLAAIGTSDYPFKGTFDGGGHYISGIVSSNGSLFGYLAGTVKNLALFDFTAVGCKFVSPIAATVGGYYSERDMESAVVHTATVSGCYVLADLAAYCDASTVYSNFGCNVSCSGVCGAVFEDCTVSDCYFIGTMSATLSGDAPSGFTPYFNALMGGVLVHNYGTIERCFAIFDTTTSGDFDLKQLCGTYYSNSGSINECYYMTDTDGIIPRGSRVSSYAELNTTFGAMEAWGSGQQLPYLLSAKHYEVLAGGSTTCIDGARLPLTNPNTLRTYSGDSEETHLWTMDNMAIYRPDSEWIAVINCELIPDYDFQFDWVSQVCYGAEGSISYELRLDGRGWYGLCLPCDLTLEDLPDGSELYYVGKKATGTINMVKVNDIAAGTPCVAYIEGTGTAVLRLSGSIVHIPGHNSEQSDIYGLFAHSELSNVAVFEVDSDGNPIFKHYDNVTASPFCIYLSDTGEDVKCVSREELYLDSSYKGNTYNINLYNGQQVPVVVRTTIPAGQWSTIALPFDMSVDAAIECFGYGYKVEELKYLQYNEISNTLTLLYGSVDMEETQYKLLAGHAYLIKPSKDFVSGSEFADVEVDADITYGEYAIEDSERGTITMKVQPKYNYGYTRPGENEKVYVYDATSDAFKQVDRYDQTNGLTFHLFLSNLSPAVLPIYHDAVSGVESVTEEPVEVVGIYDLSGRRLCAPQRGVNILRMSDGTARKVFINQ